MAEKWGIKSLSNVIWVVIDRVHKCKQKACQSVAVRSGKQEVSKMAQISSPYEKSCKSPLDGSTQFILQKL